MKTQIRRMLLLLFIVIMTATAAVIVIMTTTGSNHDASLAAESSQDAQLTALAAENGGIKQVAGNPEYVVNSLDRSDGSGHTMVLFNNGKLYGAGANVSGQLGLGDYNNKSVFTEITYFRKMNVTSVSCGNFYTMVIADGKLYGAGSGSAGQMGDGYKSNRALFSLIKDFADKNVTSVACGVDHTMVIADGKLYCSGTNYRGQLGLGTEDNAYNFTLISPVAGANVTSVSCGKYYTLAIIGGQLYGVGQGDYGQLGAMTTNVINNRFNLVPEFKNKNVTAVSCGLYNSYVLADNQLYGSGLNSNGDLGLGHNQKQLTFNPVVTLKDKQITSITAGNGFCMILADGKLYGAGFFRDVIGTTTSFTEITTFNNYTIEGIYCMGYTYTVIADDKLYIMGRNDFGQLGFGNTDDEKLFREVPLTYTVKYDGNGGAVPEGGVTMLTQTMTYQITTPLQPNPYTLAGCSLAGWAESQSDAEAGKVAYADKEKVAFLAELRESITLYAVWQPDSPEVTVATDDIRTITYGDGQIELKADFTDNGLDYTYKWMHKGKGETTFTPVNNATDATLVLENVADSGTYKVEMTAKYQSKVSAPSASSEMQVTINKAAIDPTVNISDWDHNAVTVPQPELSAYIGGGEPTYYYHGTTNGGRDYPMTESVPTEAGTYYLFAEIASTANTYSYRTAEVKFTVNREQQPVEVTFPEDTVYTGDPFAEPTVNGEVREDATTEFSYSVGADSQGPWVDGMPTEVGKYTLKVTISQTNNYAEAVFTKNVEIKGKEIGAENVELSIGDWEYGSSAALPQLTVNIDEKYNVTYTYYKKINSVRIYYDPIESPTDAGAYVLVATISAQHYADLEKSCEFNINKKTLDNITVTLNGWSYGAAPAAVSPQVGGVDSEVADKVRFKYEKQVPETDRYELYNGNIADAPAGSYRVTAILDETDNYNSAESKVWDFRINKGRQDPRVTLGNWTWTYGDKITEPIVSGVQENAEYTIKYRKTHDMLTEFPTDAGKYYIHIEIPETENYYAYNGMYSETFTIAPKTVSAPWVKSFEYDGKPHPVDSSKFETTLYDLEEAATGTDRGKYKVVLRLLDPDNHVWGESKWEISGDKRQYLTLYFYITRSTTEWLNDVPSIGIDNAITYGEEIVYSATPKNGSGDLVNVTYLNADGSKFVGTPTQAGKYKAVFTIDATDNYTGIRTEVDFKILPKEITVTINNPSRVYGETENALVYELSDDLVNGDAYEDLGLNVSRERTGDGDDVVGSYKIIVESSNPNYIISPDVKVYEILKADYEIGFAGEYEVTYDGKAHTLIFNGDLPTGKDGIEVTVTYTYSNGTGEITNVNDGPLTVTATFATDSTNYNVPAPQTATLTIVPKGLTEDLFDPVGAEDHTGTQITPEVSLSNVDPNFTESDFTHEYGANVNADKPGTIIIKGTGNYDGEITLTFTINKVRFTFDVSIFGWKYGENANGPILSGNKSDGKVTYVYKGRTSKNEAYESHFAPTEVGTYQVTVSIADGTNYLAPDPVTKGFVIELGVLDPALKISGWKYGDTASTPALSGYPDDAAITVMYFDAKGNLLATYNELKALAGKPDAGIYTLRVTIGETDNYQAKTAEKTFTINTREITVKDVGTIGTITSDGFPANSGLSDTYYYTVKDAGGSKGGKYTAVLTLKDASNTRWSEDWRGSGEISGRNNEILTLTYEIFEFSNNWTADGMPSICGEVYNGTKIKLGYNGSQVEAASNAKFGNDLVEVKYYDMDTQEELSGAPKNVGHYNAVFTIATDRNNYLYTGVIGIVDFEIMPVEVKITIENGSHTYGEIVDESELKFDYSIDGAVIDGDDLRIKLTKDLGLDAGTYAIKGTWDNGNYNVTFVEGKYTINKAKYDMDNVSFDGDTVTYDGKVHGLKVTGLPAGVSVTYVNNNKTDAGTYSVTAMFTGDANHESIDIKSATLNIEKAVYDMRNVKFEGETIEYNGKEHRIEVTGLPDGVEVTYTNNGQKNAGEYNVKARFTAKDTVNHEPLSITEKEATLTIAKAKIEGNITFNGDETTYDGKVHSLKAENLPVGVIRVDYDNNNQTNAGEYTVTAKFTVDANYEAIEDMTATLVIAKAKIEGSITFSGGETTYDGKVHSLRAENLPAGVVRVDYDNNNQTNAGEYTVTAKFTVDANYEAIEDVEAVLTIKKAKYEGIAFNGNTVTYNGKAHSLEVEGRPADVTVMYTNNGQINAGEYEVTAKFTVDANHEAIPDMKATLTINKAKYQVPAFEDVTVTYDGESHSLKVSGVPYGVTVEYEGNGKKEAGTYTVTAKFTGDANYEALGDLTATLTIIEKGGCGSVVVDGATIAGIAISVLAFATYLAIRRAKSKKK